jgi:formylglycine-generating enzyme required for sulfatase activity
MERINESEKRRILEKAAECYEKAGWRGEAGRVWEEMGRYKEAGENYREEEMWEKAAECYEKGGMWGWAGWIRVDKLKQKYRSLEIISKVAAKNEREEIEKEIIKSRGEKREKKRGEIGEIVRRIVEYGGGEGEKHLYEWGQVVASQIKRPDLKALLYWKAKERGIAGSEEAWEKWTKRPRKREEEWNYEYETVRVNRKGEIVERAKKRGKCYQEKVAGIEIEMVYIPGGRFVMGTGEEEIERLVQKYDWNWYRKESPEHEVRVEEFYLGKYPITQKQWKEIALLEKVERELNPEPSRFKGENRPVERVSWEEAVEFCRRLRRETGKEYKLPSEAQWEYGCRGGTKTAFSYGETLTEELANYRASETYAEERAGRWLGETTEVGKYPANPWGLYDMHGNVWEWCEDEWHKNYEGAPQDGRAWQGGDSSAYVVRGGSWLNYSDDCRSAYRLNVERVVRNYNNGFRVVCEVGRTF